MGIFTSSAPTKIPRTCWGIQGIVLSTYGPWKFNGKYYIVTYDFGPPELEEPQPWYPNVYRSADGVDWEVLDQMHDGTFMSWYTDSLRWDANGRFAFDAVNGKVYALYTYSPRVHPWDDNTNYLSISVMDISVDDPVWRKNITGEAVILHSGLVPASRGDAQDIPGDEGTAFYVMPDGNLRVYYALGDGGDTACKLQGVTVNITGHSGIWGDPFTVNDESGSNIHSVPYVVSDTGDLLFFTGTCHTIAYEYFEGEQTLKHFAEGSGVKTITNDFGQNIIGEAYIGRIPPGAEMAVVVGSDQEDPLNSLLTYHYVWLFNGLTWSRITEALPFPHSAEAYLYRWSTFTYHLYGDSAMTAFRSSPSDITVIISTTRDGGDSPDNSFPAESWLWEFTWNGASWSFELLDHLINENDSSKPNYFWSVPSVVKHSDGYGLIYGKLYNDFSSEPYNHEVFVRFAPFLVPEQPLLEFGDRLTMSDLVVMNNRSSGGGGGGGEEEPKKFVSEDCQEHKIGSIYCTGWKVIEPCTED